MRHVFILNPAAGKKQKALHLRERIEQAFANEPDETCEILVTSEPRDAEHIARREAQKGDAVRIYACGGDGTLMETASGLLGFSNAQLAVVPCGSANDFVRAFGKEETFLEIADLIHGEEHVMDAISCNGKLSMNLCSMGMDADVGYRMKYFKRWPLVSGPASYGLAVLVTLLHKIGHELRIVMEVEDETGRHVVERNGDYLFALAANGQYYGGGYRGAPKAKPDDGLLDFVLIRTISRIQAIGLLKKYKAGQHLDLDICESFRGVSMKVFANKGAVVNVDGECTVENETCFEIIPNAIRFVLPRSLMKTEVTV